MPEPFKLRSDLIIRHQEKGDRAEYVIKDPLTGRFFGLRGPEHFLISQMDGATSIDEAVARFTARFDTRLPPGAAEAFFQKMQKLCLFEGIYAEAALSRSHRWRRPGRSVWSRLLMWRIAAFDPGRLVEKIERRTRWMFNTEFVFLAVGIIGLSLLVAGANRSTFFLGLSEIFQVGSIIGILAAIFVLAVFHEFAHAVALRHYGGSVSEMGILLLYFQPCVYCNLSDAYLLPDKKQKASVMLAGLLVQLVVTALAVFLWRITEIGTLLNRFCFLVAAVSLAVALFNLNPLIKLDGYYLLADWLGLPNLRARAFGYLKRRFVFWLTGKNIAHPDDRHGRVFLWYGIIALLYSAFLIAFVGYHLTVFLAERLGWAGPLVLWGAVGILAARPLWRGGGAQSAEEGADAGEGKNTGDRAVSRKARQVSAGQPPPSPPALAGGGAGREAGRRRSKRPLIFWGIIGLAIISSFFIRTERRVGSSCRVEPSSVFSITNPEPGIIETWLHETGTHEKRERTSLQLASADFSAINITPRFAEGERVRTGDTVLVISSNRYQSQLASTEARLEKAQAESNLLLSGPKKEEIRQLRAELAQVEAQLENEEAEFDRAGRMHGKKLISDEEYELGRTRLAIAREAKKAKQSELSLLISEPKIEEIAIKEAEIAELTALLDYYRSQIAASVFIAPFAGQVSRVREGKAVFEMVRTDTVRVVIPTSEEDIGEVNIGAMVRLKVRSYPFEVFEGRVAKLAIAASTTGEKSKYEVITAIPNPGGRLLPGMTGYAKIFCGDRRLISLILRRVVYFFRVEFWSWW